MASVHDEMSHIEEQLGRDKDGDQTVLQRLQAIHSTCLYNSPPNSPRYQRLTHYKLAG